MRTYQSCLAQLIFFLSCIPWLLFAESFPFTGELSGESVRLRLEPHLSSPIVDELEKGSFLLVTGQKGKFYAVRAPEGMRAFVFHKYLKNSLITHDHVNLRLKPEIDSPLLGQLDRGEFFESFPSPSSKYWISLPIPARFSFYVAKTFVKKRGEASLFWQLQCEEEDKKKGIADFRESIQKESKKNFCAARHLEITKHYFSLIERHAGDEQLHDRIQRLYETFLQERRENKRQYFESPPSLGDSLWHRKEKTFYLSWIQEHPGASFADFEKEERRSSVLLEGILTQAHDDQLQLPGDYLLCQKGRPLAYLYSIDCDLSPYLGQKVSLLGQLRAQNHFSIPLYHVSNKA